MLTLMQLVMRTVPTKWQVPLALDSAQDAS
jgi:hypothetical protein